jgi:hypothetical protein
MQGAVHATPSTVKESPVGTLVIVCVMAGCAKLAVTAIALFIVTVIGFDPLFTLPVKPVNW